MPINLMGSLRSRNISRIITERIVEGILNGELVAGQRLPTEEEFAVRIGASKSSVREAIKILEAQGVLEIRRGDGTYVVDEFKGSMLDQTVYGILLAKKSREDVIDFLVRVQGMASDDLLEHVPAEQLEAVAETLAASGEDSVRDAKELLLAVEGSIADKITNPLVGELYRQAVRIADHERQLRATELLAWLRRYVQALAHGDASEVRLLLQEERELLMTLPGE